MKVKKKKINWRISNIEYVFYTIDNFQLGILHYILELKY